MQKRLCCIVTIIVETVSSRECVGNPKAFADKPIVCVPVRNPNFWWSLGDTRWSVRFPKPFQANFVGVRK